MIGVEWSRYALMLMLTNVILRLALNYLIKAMPGSPLPDALAFAIV